MDGNLKNIHQNIWYIVGRPFGYFSKLDQVTTFDGFMYSVLKSNNPKQTVGILGQGLSLLEIQSLHSLPKHFPQITILGKSHPVDISLGRHKARFYLENRCRVDSSKYECDLNLTEWLIHSDDYRLPMHVLIEAGSHFLDDVLKEDLHDWQYGVKVTELLCNELNIPFPVQTKVELTVINIKVKKSQLFVKSRLRFYQNGRLSFEMRYSVHVMKEDALETIQAAQAKKTLEEGVELLGV